MKQTITLLADDENALREAILKPEVFRHYVLVQSASARQNYTPGELQYLDTLLGSVAQEYPDTRTSITGFQAHSTRAHNHRTDTDLPPANHHRPDPTFTGRSTT